MLLNSETPPVGGGASRNSFGGWFRDPITHLEVQVQILIAVHPVRRELAAMIAGFAFGGHGNA